MKFITKHFSTLKLALHIFKLFTSYHEKLKIALVIFLITLMEVTSTVVVIALILLTLKPDSYINYINENFSNISQLNITEPIYYLVPCFSVSILFLLVRNGVIHRCFRFLFQTTFGIGGKISRNIIVRYFQKGLLFFTENKQPHLWKTAMVDPYAFSNIIFSLIVIAVDSFIALLILLFLGFYKPEILAPVAISLIPMFYITFKVYKDRISKISHQNQIVYNNANANINSILHGYTDIHINNKLSYFLDKYQLSRTEYDYNNAKLQGMLQMPSRIVETLLFLSLSIVYIITYLLYQGNMNLVFETISLFVGSVFRLVPSINRMIAYFLKIKESGYSVETIQKYKPHNEPVSKATAELTENLLSVELKNVYFHYPNSEKGLNGLSLTINSGDFIGLVGKSGAGKSTVLKILLRELIPQQGSVEVNNIRINELNLQNWYDSIGYVQQRPFLLNDSLQFNITFEDDKNIDELALKKAIEIALLEDVVNDLPEGTKTHIGEQGDKLSGGQKQRIAIARAIYKKAKILLFDEVTSALDQETEKLLIDNTKVLKENGYTLLMVTHRTQSLKHCDVIYEMEAGKIVKELSFDKIPENNF